MKDTEDDWSSAKLLTEAEKELYNALSGLENGDLITASQCTRRASSYIREGWTKRGGKPKSG
jgi:hypothetical protein